MATYTPHMLVAFGGTLGVAGGDFGQGTEIWQCGVRVRPMNGQAQLDSTDYDEVLAGLREPLGSWFTTPAHGMADTAFLTWAKANHIGANGKYVDNVTHRIDYPQGERPGGSPTNLPWTSSVCISWNTTISRGRASKGRIFPPNGTCAPCWDENVPQAWMDKAGAAGTALIDLLGGTAGLWVPVVASGLDGSMHDIINVAVGSILDNQRRRKDALVERYSHYSL